MLLAACLTYFVSCDKPDEDQGQTYSGVVKRQTTDCGGNMGKMFIVKIDNSLDYDSIYAAGVPENLQIKGLGITFKMRDYDGTKNEVAICNTQIMKLIPKIIFNVSASKN